MLDFVSGATDQNEFNSLFEVSLMKSIVSNILPCKQFELIFAIIFKTNRCLLLLDGSNLMHCVRWQHVPIVPSLLISSSICHHSWLCGGYRTVLAINLDLEVE